MLNDKVTRTPRYSQTQHKKIIREDTFQYNGSILTLATEAVHSQIPSFVVKIADRESEKYTLKNSIQICYIS